MGAIARARASAWMRELAARDAICVDGLAITASPYLERTSSPAGAQRWVVAAAIGAVTALVLVVSVFSCLTSSWP